jgi:hypothetical protein
MPSVEQLSAVYGNFMRSPRRGEDVCEICFNLTDGHARCYACAHGQQWLDAIAPISYSIAGEQLHHALAAYKRLSGAPARRLQRELAAVLWRHLAEHESCLARAAGLGRTAAAVFDGGTAPGGPRFPIVTSVPAATPARDENQPLRAMIARLIAPTRERYERLLRRSGVAVEPRAFDRRRFEAVRPLDGEAILLIDDTWTTGASAQSAAAALKCAGAGTVAALVIGRHVHRDWRGNDARLRALVRPFPWEACPLCASPPSTAHLARRSERFAIPRAS